MANELSKTNDKPILELPQVKPEDFRKPSDMELEVLAGVYRDLNDFRNVRATTFPQLQNNTPEDFWGKSRSLFWNSVKNESEDLSAMGINFSIGFARKETLDFLGRLIQLQIKPRFTGTNTNQFALRVLQALYNNWRTKSNDKTEKFWQLLYGIVNGTVAIGVGYSGEKKKERFLRAYDPESGMNQFEEKDLSKFADVLSNIIPIEELYFPTMSERNIQKMGRVLRRQQMEFNRFKNEFGGFENSRYVLPGFRMAEDSLYLQLLGNSTSRYVEVVYEWNTFLDQYVIFAGGIWLNPVGKNGKEQIAANPFKHKKIPIVLSQFRPLDNNFPYGMSLPFEIKDPDRIANVSMTILVERELRISSPPILTSDIEAPDLIFGNNQVIPVSDVDQYKEIQVKEPGQGFFQMTAALQNIMTTHSQGGQQNPAPSRQPQAARTDMIQESMKAMYQANTIAMYADMLWQEIRLELKTMLQFYPTSKFANEDKNIIHQIMVPNSPLLQGGNGNLEFRVVKQKTDPEQLYWESINKSIVNGKMTEIIECPPEVLQAVDFEIGDIALESEQAPEIAASNFVANVLKPMVEIYIPNGLADPAKVFLRHMEVLGEHPSDFAPDSMLPKMYQIWSESWQMKYGPDGKPIVINPQQDQAGFTGNVQQQQNGMQNGPAGGAPAGGAPGPGGPPQVTPKFGSQDNPALQEMLRFEQKGI